MIISPRPSLRHTSGTTFHFYPNRLTASVGYVKARWHRQADRRPARIVEIVDVKITEPVVALESTEFLQVQITADEHAGRAQQGGCTLIGAAIERERISMRACKASSRSWIGLAPMSNLHALRKSNGRFGLERSPPAARIRLKT
jgi:hypothetical protein